MLTARTVQDLRRLVSAWRRAGSSIGVVPTMGALHAGHLSLAAASRERAGRSIVTLFVNPRQFNDPADLARYPRTEESDREKLAPLGIDLLFAPPPEVMYPAGFATNISVSGATDGLCGADRPGHFDGVATVVSKLLIQTGADFAFFGEKDYQQLATIRRMVRDLDLPVEIVGCPTVRDPDGLALSSRNALLSPEERACAPALHHALVTAAERLRDGEDAGCLADAAAGIAAAGFSAVDYVELRDAEDLAPMQRLDRPARLLAAAHIGRARLIDNIPVEPAA
ncbi:MAG: pantoate--beta-alanine ligase [Alphaproteobacteria bacterium]|nr:pantoate--beta-alanine ligase [Alphaproteobacteria bacterium]